jgi:hypothetical protein
MMGFASLYPSYTLLSKQGLTMRAILQVNQCDINEQLLQIIKMLMLQNSWVGWASPTIRMSR